MPGIFWRLPAAIILSLNPWSLLDPGFQLSFGAVIAIFFVAPVFSRPLEVLPAALREAIAITTAASLVTAPIMMYHFNQVSLVTVPANVAAAPVAGPVMLLGTLSILLSPVSSLAAWTLNGISAICTAYLIAVAHFLRRDAGSCLQQRNAWPDGNRAFLRYANRHGDHDEDNRHGGHWHPGSGTAGD